MPAHREPNRHVLIVEDDEATREAFALILGHAGYTAHTAAHGEEALAFLAGEPRPSVIVLDLMMPVMDGHQFRRRQAADARIADIPVIVCTAAGEARESAALLRAADFLAKPIDPPALVEVVARYC